MIVIEGPDNSGKSTLAKKLSSELGIPTLHSSKPDGGVNQVLMKCYQQLRPQRAIRDRVHVISEYVYGPTIRGGSALGKYHQDVLMDLYCRNYLIIYCRPKTRLILSNSRPQMDGVVENHKRIIEEYDDLMGEIALHTNLLRYDWEGDIFDNILLRCREYMEEYQKREVSALFMCKFRGQESEEREIDRKREWASRGFE